MSQFCSIPEGVEELKKGKMLIVVDNPSRENQGDLIFPAETATKQKVNFMIKTCGGLICVPIITDKAVQLDLPLMVSPLDNTEKTGVNFTVSVDAKGVKSFGVSAVDRAMTIKVIANNKSKPSDLVRPGHVFPLLAQAGGIKEREGHTEATVELLRLAGFNPCGVLTEILTPIGEIARVPDLIEFASRYRFKIVSISDLIEYLKSKPQERLREYAKPAFKTASSYLQTKFGNFQISVYKSLFDSKEHTVLAMGKKIKEPALVRIHSQCLTGDSLYSIKCDCRQQLHRSMRLIAQKGQGVVIYLNQEGRGIGLSNKIRAYHLQEDGLDTVEANEKLGFNADERNYKIAAMILKDLGMKKVKLLTNNPSKVEELEKCGINVVKQVPVEILPSRINKDYLRTKKTKLGHRLMNV